MDDYAIGARQNVQKDCKKDNTDQWVKMKKLFNIKKKKQENTIIMTCRNIKCNVHLLV